MRRAMAEADVGDAEYDDDPTVNRLQAKAAELTGKEAAIYIWSRSRTPIRSAEGPRGPSRVSAGSTRW